MDTAISWRGVAKSFGPVKALDGVSIDVREGEILGLLGPNGAGKSTLLAIATGIESPDAGDVVLAPGARAGFMPQEYALYPTLSAWENAMYVARSWGSSRMDARAEVAQVLELTGLEARAHARVSTLSGGTRRRLSLAIALLGSPRVLVLDEPTGGVDPESTIALVELVARASERGTAVVYSTHHMEEVQALADRVAILHEGRLLCSGPVEEIVERYGGAYLELEMLTSHPERVTALLRDSGAFFEVVHGCAENGTWRYGLPVADRGAALAAAVDAAVAAGGTVTDLRLREPTLGAAFMTLTGRELCDA